MTERPILPAAETVSFRDIDGALSRLVAEGPSVRARTATVVAVGPTDRLHETASAIQQASGRSGLRAILIPTGEESAPVVRLADMVVVLEGLKPSHVNNAVAALRLSSLPTLVWWRGGPVDTLASLASLADRVLLDADDPAAGWQQAASLAAKVPISDMRWTRLTRWRALMAHFFDIPEVLAVAGGFTRLELGGSDRHALRLLAGWMISALPSGDRLTIAVSHGGSAPVEHIRLVDQKQELGLRLLSTSSCVESTARVDGHAGATRVVPLGRQDLATLLAAELRIRARDLSFERALAAMPSDAR